jgi:salicylate hydroxylase
MPLKVVVVGAGISGLATAIGFARHGHHVIVYERKESRTEDSGSGIQLQPNAMRILESWGLKEDVEEIAHLSGVMKTRRYDSGKTVGMVPNGGKKE